MKNEKYFSNNEVNVNDIVDGKTSQVMAEGNEVSMYQRCQCNKYRQDLLKPSTGEFGLQPREVIREYLGEGEWVCPICGRYRLVYILQTYNRAIGAGRKVAYCTECKKVYGQYLRPRNGEAEPRFKYFNFEVQREEN